MKTHEDDGFRYTCAAEECRNAGVGKYKQRSDYVRHLEKHAGKSFSCEQCGKTFPSKKGVYDHTVRVHRPVIECKNKKRGCEYKTKDSKLMKKHYKECK